MSKSNRAQVETSTIVGVTDNGTWEAEQFAAEQSARQQAEAKQAELPAKQSKEVTDIVESTRTKSDKIRALIALGEKRGSVAKLLGIRYQHVRNVEITPIKRKA
jgi:hypothetical protein